MNVCLEKKGRVAIITIDRQETLNALSTSVLKELEQQFHKVYEDEDIYVTILTGAGRAFVAGGDVAEMRDFTPREGMRYSELGHRVFSYIEDLRKPTIAAINGYALGGGCELAMACDIRIAAESAKFGQPEVRLGIIPGFGGTQRLPRIVGAARAKEIIFTAGNINAAEAFRIGLVNHVVPDAELMDTAMAMAEKIASNAQVAVREAKLAINAGLQCDIKTGNMFEIQTFTVCYQTADRKDAMEAFINKVKLKEYTNK